MHAKTQITDAVKTMQDRGWTIISGRGCNAANKEICPLAAVLVAEKPVKARILSSSYNHFAALIRNASEKLGLSLHNTEAFMSGFDGQSVKSCFETSDPWLDRETPMKGRVLAEAKNVASAQPCGRPCGPATATDLHVRDFERPLVLGDPKLAGERRPRELTTGMGECVQNDLAPQLLG